MTTNSATDCDRCHVNGRELFHYESADGLSGYEGASVCDACHTHLESMAQSREAMVQRVAAAAPTILDDKDIIILNAARTILDGIAKRTARDYAGGIIDGAARAAEHDLFMVLNHVNVYGERHLSYRQLHNREPVTEG